MLYRLTVKDHALNEEYLTVLLDVLLKSIVFHLIVCIQAKGSTEHFFIHLIHQ